MKKLILTSALLGHVLASSHAQPAFISQPQSQSVSLGVNVVLYAPAYGSSTITYQWRKDGALVPDANLEMLFLDPLRAVDQGDYDVIASNLSGSVTSQVARITINPDFYKVSDSPVNDSGGLAWSGVWGDYDQDGWLDLFVPYDNFMGNRLYRNNNDGTFTAVEGSPLNDASISWGAAWGDIDNDGALDLLVGNFATNNLLYRNAGNGTFSRVGNSPITSDSANTFGVSWVDTDNDGWLDIYVANYPIFNGFSQSGTNYLYRNQGDGSFTIVPNPPGSPNGLYTGSAWADYNNDGRQDLFLTRLGNSPNYLFRNLGRNQFAAVNDPELMAAAVHSIGGAWGDYDNDGFLDLLVPTGTPFVSSHACILLRNQGDGTFQRLTNQEIVTLTGRASGAAWADYDNDGWLDAFVSYANQPNVLWHNEGDGTFRRITTGSLVNDPGDTRGCAWGDYNNDGFLDLFVAGYDRANLLYRNSGNSNAWFGVECVGRSSNRLGLGAKVRVAATIGGTNRWLLREITGGCSLGSHALRASFGLGDATLADVVRIEWPSGIVQEFSRVQARQTLRAIEPEIRVGPANPGAALGAEFIFSLVALPQGHFTMQWFHEGLALEGATNPVLVLPAVQTNDFGRYTIRLCDHAGTVIFTAAPVILTNAVKPMITRQPLPAAQSVSVGAIVRLLPTFTGHDPMHYEWRLNDVPVPDQTNSTLILTNVQATDAGRYQVFASNLAGAVTSQVATVNVDPMFVKTSYGSIVSDGGSSFGAACVDLGTGPASGLLVLNSGLQKPFLYANDGKGAFTSVGADQVGTLLDQRGDMVGVAVGDYNNDGLSDVFVANYNSRTNYLYRAEPGGSFSRVFAGELTSRRANHWTGAWGDVNNDGWLDLFVSLGGPLNALHMNNGDGTFTSLTNSLVSSDPGNFRACTWVDYDNDRDLDLFVARMGGTNCLYQNTGNGAFVKANAGKIVGEVGGGNGCAWADYDNDGDLDALIARPGPNLFYENNGDGTFSKITTGAVATESANSWTAAWADYDNDGWLDLFVANTGWKSFFRNNGDKTFTKITTGSLVNDFADTRGCVWADFNADGFPDVFVSNFGSNNNLYLNAGNANHWLKVQCAGRTSNRSGIGAKVRVLAAPGTTNLWQMREITSGDGLGSQQLVAMFGLGQATQAEKVRIEWPSGAVQEFENVQANQSMVVQEPPPVPQPAFSKPRFNGGAFEFEVDLYGAGPCIVQTSTNLVHWENCTPVTNTDGKILIQRAPDSAPLRFYRTVDR